MELKTEKPEVVKPKSFDVLNYLGPARTHIGLILILVILCIALSFASPAFATTNNMYNILTQVAIFGIVAIGMTFVILTGGIDLSVGSITGFVGVVAADLVLRGLPLFSVVFICLLLGAFLGLVNGFFISYTKLPPFIMTLCTMTAIRGIIFIYTGGKPFSGLPEEFLFIGRGSMFGVPVPVILMIITFIIGWFILNHTVFGRSVYAIGGNAMSSRLAGLPVKRNITFVYMISGVTCGLAGIILASRLASAQPMGGTGLELEAIAITALGGVSLAGGIGTLGGVFLGTVLIGVINNGMNLIAISSYWQLVVKGAVIAGAVLYDINRKKK